MSNPTQTAEPTRPNWSSEWSVVGTLIVLIVFGLFFRATNLDAIGFAEDEVNKVDAVGAYALGDITANAEHPMLMKVFMYASVKVGRALKGRAVSDEVLFRLPNAIFGALTVIPLFLLTAAFFDRWTGLLAAGFWTGGLNAITFNRIGKEETLLVAYIIIQRGRVYFKNQDKIALVRATFTKVHEVKVKGLTAAEIFVNQPW